MHIHYHKVILYIYCKFENEQIKITNRFKKNIVNLNQKFKENPLATKSDYYGSMD